MLPSGRELQFTSKKIPISPVDFQMQIIPKIYRAIPQNIFLNLIQLIKTWSIENTK